MEQFSEDVAATRQMQEGLGVPPADSRAVARAPPYCWAEPMSMGTCNTWRRLTLEASRLGGVSRDDCPQFRVLHHIRVVLQTSLSFLGSAWLDKNKTQQLKICIFVHFLSDLLFAH